MTAQNMRRIQVASFSFNDVARTHVAALVLGAALVLAAGGCGWVAAVNTRAIADATAAARLLIAASSQVLRSSPEAAAGAPTKLTQALGPSAGVHAGLMDLRASAGSAVAAPSLAGAANVALASAGKLLSAAVEIEALAGANKPVAPATVGRAVNAANEAKAAAEQLGTLAMRSDAAVTLAAGAAGLLLAGLGVLGAALMRILADFGRRYHRGVQQFRAGDTARQALARELRRAAESADGDLAVTELTGEMAEISRLINVVGQRQASALSSIQQGAQGALKEEAHAAALMAEAEEQSRALGDGLRELGVRVAQVATLTRLVSVDAQAASMAADEASAHSANANQVAQDAASRMEALREALQETSKGVKRLGERTQEIDGVVETMELLSEQIGVLALNASLEAERAGEAGAGFRVVAREVQSLAHRSEEALQQISGLVQGAQADARAAATLLERSTQQVVAGSNVGAVSHALLAAIPPMAAGVDSMVRSIAQTGREGEAQLGQVQTLLRGATAAADASAGKSAQARAPLARVRKDLTTAAGEA